jgi:micrococcal nuclease
VIDGDTIVARLPDGHREVVRYIGMNTPELHHPTRGAEPGGLEARAQNAALLQGKQITLAFDVDTRDRYGRLLAYVYADGAFVNGDLVRRGYAATATYAPNVCHADEFRQLERAARSTNAGLWGTSPITRQVIADSSHIDLRPRAETSPALGVYSGQDGTVSSTGISAASTDSSNHGPVQVRGYTRKDGTSVAPHTRSVPGSGGGRRR